jgi:hypothetical protein
MNAVTLTSANKPRSDAGTLPGAAVEACRTLLRALGMRPVLVSAVAA